MAENEENTTGNDVKPQDTYHLSVGSAATGVHFSMDIAVDDPQFTPKVNMFLQKWADTNAAAALHRSRSK